MWIDGEKLDACPTCGKQLEQAEYDFQHCRACEGSTAARYASVGNVDLCEMPSGMQLELEWSKDETMVRLSITKHELSGRVLAKSIRLSSLELDELRAYLNDRIR